MKKIMGGLRRNRTSLTTATPNNNNNNLHQDSSSPSEEEEVNYATLFDNDHDENCKENSVNSNNNTNSMQRTGNTQRAKNSMASMKKRKKLPPQKLLGAVVSSNREVVLLPMMTISEMAGEEDDDEEFTEDGSGSGGDEEVGVTTATAATVQGEGEGELVAIMDGGEEDIHLLSGDRVEMIEERYDVEDVTQSDQDLNEDCQVIQQHDNHVVEEFKACDNNEVVEPITIVQNVDGKEEEEQEAIVDVHVVANKEVKVMAASSIAQDANKCVGEEVSSSLSCINEHTDINDGGIEEIIHQEEDGNNSSEEVTQQQQQQQQQQVCHANVTQHSHHYNTHVKEAGDEKTRSYLATRGLYTRSSYMESLRIKYQVV